MTTRLRIFVVVALAVSGCGARSTSTRAAESAKPPAEITAAKAPTCDRAAKHKADLFAGVEQFQDVPASRMDAIRTMIAVLEVEILKECLGMGWSDEARACAVKSATLDGFATCHPRVDTARYPGAETADTGIAECDAYVASFARLASCPHVVSDAVVQAQYLTARGGWSALREAAATDPLRQSVVGLCKKAADGLPALGRSIGCE
jgi:hypothetical protein